MSSEAAVDERPAVDAAQQERNLQYQQEIDALNLEMAQVAEGKHPVIMEKVEILQKIKARREEVAKTHHQHLLQNAEDLHQFEILDAEAAMKIAREQLQESLKDTVKQEILRCEEEIQRGIGPPPDEPPPPTKKQKPDPPNKRPRKYQKVKPGAGKDAAGAAAPGWPETCHINLGLTDVEMRSDFAAIIDDYRSRALAYLTMCGNSQWCQVDVVEDAKSGPIIKVNGVTYKIGDRVTIFSRTTEEEFRGEITSIRAQMVFVRLVGNVPTRLHVDHISNGRLTITKEKQQQQEAQNR